MEGFSLKDKGHYHCFIYVKNLFKKERIRSHIKNCNAGALPSSCTSPQVKKVNLPNSDHTTMLASSLTLRWDTSTPCMDGIGGGSGTPP